mmetsp:Transcript_9974/g.22680  ORF Transcript_9974/g.22680 Transcript_9974/m.22680 type:complete len:226 (-) Transcript_9974:104-781(-)
MLLLCLLLLLIPHFHLRPCVLTHLLIPVTETAFFIQIFLLDTLLALHDLITLQLLLRHESKLPRLTCVRVCLELCLDVIEHLPIFLRLLLLFGRDTLLQIRPELLGLLCSLCKESVVLRFLLLHAAVGLVPYRRAFVKLILDFRLHHGLRLLRLPFVSLHGGSHCLSSILFHLFPRRLLLFHLCPPDLGGLFVLSLNHPSVVLGECDARDGRRLREGHLAWWPGW